MATFPFCDFFDFGCFPFCDYLSGESLMGWILIPYIVYFCLRP